jgi:predicted transcriptional regulator
MIEQLREEDQLILTLVKDGKDDVQKITQATTLENHQVTYAFKKLEEHGLLKITRPDKMIERTINGQKRVFQHPKQAELTDKARKTLNNSENKDIDEYQNLTHQELVKKVHHLEHRVDELESKLEIFRRQIQSRLD